MHARWIAVVALVALLVAGCGGSGRLSKAEYEQRVQADAKAVESAVAKISRNPSSLSQLATEVDVAETAVTKAADDLERAKPPQDATADNATIARGLRMVATQLEKLKKAAAAGDAVAAQQASAAIQNAPEIIAAEKAIIDLRQKGYTIGALGA